VAISVVGGIAASAINGGNPSLVLTGMGVAQNDVVLVFGGIGGSTAGTQGASGNTSGAFQQLVSSDSGANQFYVGWQRMGATPDTTITCTGNGDAGDGAAYACIVLRGVTTDSPPTDATTTTATPTTSTNPDPPQIDWSTAGTAVIVGALSAVNDAAITIPSGYSTTNMASFTATANDGEDASVAIAYDLTPADPENPGTFTGWASGLWQAATVAIKPAAGTFGDGALSGGSIAGTATLVGFGDAPMAASATGTGTATFGGFGDAPIAASATGTGTASFAGVEIITAGALAATGTVTASFAGDYDAFNCGLLLNDGSSYVLLNDDSVVLLNDDSCLAPPSGGSVEDADLSATGTGAAAFAGASTADSVLAATGTGTATFVGASSADSALAATGTGTALFTGASTADAPFSITGTGTASFNGESTADSVLSATGTATAAFVGDYDSLYNCGLVLNDGTSFVLLNDGGSVVLLNDASCALPPVVGSALSATGTGTATFIGASTADGALAATGTWTASFVGASTADASLSATGTATVSFVGASNADSILAATGTATVSWNYAEEGQAAASATGTATVSFVGAATADSVLTSLGVWGAPPGVFQNDVFQENVFQTGGGIVFVGDSDVATPEVPPVAGGGGGAGGFPGAWKARKKRKKKDALDELDELLVAVSAQIAPWSAAQAYEADQALYRSVLERGKQLDMDDTLARIEAEIVNVKELLAEMDDEEALLLLM
jgi:hypothetical protein